jgi:putative membrane protein
VPRGGIGFEFSGPIEIGDQPGLLSAEVRCASVTVSMPARGTWKEARLPLVLAASLAAVFSFTLVDPPAGRLNWLLEVGPGLAGMAVMAITFRRFPLSRIVYVGCFLHILILVYGGYYTYADTPLGNWARDHYRLSRNHYDRVGHLALGFFPALVIREILLRTSPLRRGGWLAFITCAIAFAIAAFYELVEWWTTLVVAGDVGQKFLGSQGDPWDAQWDMFLGLVGAVASLVVLGRIHDRSMAALEARVTPRPSVQA